jgi:hypothetical protein
MSKGYKVVESRDLTEKIKYLRVEVNDIKVTLTEIFHSLIGLSWINTFFPEGHVLHECMSVRAQGTIEAIRNNFNDGNNPTLNKHTGEKLVSEISRKTLIEKLDCKEMDIPIAELYKQKKDGNPGFDFHVVLSSANIILFGEAKYIRGRNAYDSAMSQINDFISQQKDIMDLADLNHFVSHEILDKVNHGEKGFVAAFSATTKTDDTLINNLSHHKDYTSITGHSYFVFIAVNL